jgi:fluoride ion exporter CrcB/FEX
MVNLSMILLFATCGALRAVPGHIASLVAGVGQYCIREQLASLSATISDAMIAGRFAGWVITLGLLITLWCGSLAVGCLGAFTTFFRFCVGYGNVAAKAWLAGGGGYVLLSVGLSLLAFEVEIWLSRQDRA